MGTPSYMAPELAPALKVPAPAASPPPRRARRAEIGRAIDSTESLDSMLCEFTDTAIDFTEVPPEKDATDRVSKKTELSAGEAARGASPPQQKGKAADDSDSEFELSREALE